jgi:hypothetical protein
MALQSNVNVNLIYGVESTFGTAASAGGAAKVMRRIDSSLNLSKQTFASNEVRSDLEVSDLRHGMKQVSGSISGELCLTAWDDFIEAALCGTWAAGTTIAGTDAVTTQTNSVTRGAGSWIADGIKVGDVVRFSNLSTAGNNAVNLTVVGLTATVMTVAETILVNAVGDSAWDCSVVGYKLKTGTVQRSFTIEQNYPQIDISERYTGVRVGSMKIGVTPNAMASVSFDLMGQNGQMLSAASAPYFLSPTAATITTVASGSSGSVRVGGATSSVVTAFDISVNNSLSDAPVVGSDITPNIFYGRRTVTGTVSMYIEDKTQIDNFVNETEVDLMVRLNTNSTAPQDFISIALTRVKLSGMSKSISADGGVIASFPFQALLREGVAGYDQTSITIQRSV